MASVQVERVREEQSHCQEQQHKEEKIEVTGSACSCQEKVNVKEQYSAQSEAVKEHKGYTEQIKEAAAKANQVLHELKEHKDGMHLLAGKKQDQSCTNDNNHGASLQGTTAVQKKEGTATCYNGHHQHRVVPEVNDEVHYKDHNGGAAQVKKSKEDHQSKKYQEEVVSEKKETKSASGKKTVCELKVKEDIKSEKKDKKKKKKKKEKVYKKKSEGKDSSSSSSSSSESEGECKKEKKNKNEKKRC